MAIFPVNFTLIKLKKILLLAFAVAFVFLPGQNWYLTVPLLADSLEQPGVLLPPLSATYPVDLVRLPPPILTAQAVIVLDVNSGTVLYRFNEDFPLLPASTVKIMTALVALDYYSLDQVITIGEIETLGQTFDFKPGQRFQVKDLLLALLVGSANDAAEILAANYHGGRVAFVAAMNQKAKDLKLTRTHFANPTGLDSDVNERQLKDINLTTALDLSRLARVALANSFIAASVDKSYVTITELVSRQTYPIYNINVLLSKRSEIKGIKTGWTEEAGECLVALAQKPSASVITVILGSQDRFGETEELVDWVYGNFSWQEITEPIQGQWR